MDHLHRFLLLFNALCVMFRGLHLAHHAQPVLAPNLFDVGFREPLPQKGGGEVDEFRRIGQPFDAAIAVEIGAKAHVVDAHHVDSMVQMGHGIADVGLTFLAQKAVIERDLRYTSRLSERL